TERKGGFDDAGTHKAIVAYVENRYKPNLHRLIDLHQQSGEQALPVSQAAHPNAFLRYGDDVLVSVPAEYRSWVMALVAMNAATQQVCREHPYACHFIDVAAKLPVERSDFYDFAHTTPSGSRKLGRFISRELRALTIPSSGV